jgi:TRAP-type C4-dicarboxylate transport system permease small subunit
MNLRTRVDALSTGLDKAIGWSCIIFGMIMTVSTLIGILFRYVMTNPLPWTEELARYTMIWMGLLAVSMGVKREAHLSLNLLVKQLPRPVRIFFKGICRILTGIFLYILIVFGTKMAMSGMHQTMPALQIPMVFVLGAVPLCGLFSLVQLVLITIMDVTGKEI